MKMTLMLARIRPRRQGARKEIESGLEWSTRDWADLPIYHPKKD